MDFKYIVIAGGLTDEIIIFTPTLAHASVAMMINRKVISAGFIRKDWTCYGESTTLQIKAREAEDTQLAKDWHQ